MNRNLCFTMSSSQRDHHTRNHDNGQYYRLHSVIVVAISSCNDGVTEEPNINRQPQPSSSQCHPLYEIITQSGVAEPRNKTFRPSVPLFLLLTRGTGFQRLARACPPKPILLLALILARGGRTVFPCRPASGTVHCCPYSEPLAHQGARLVHYRSHFGSRYNLGCCDLAGLFAASRYWAHPRCHTPASFGCFWCPF